jgi:transcriptional regulator with XRE-family HTH domain
VADHSELADFLKARRALLHPADVGLPDTGRRRTPGLRREEVAALAGVSIDYLVRLEQGRDTNPSLEVLDSLAGALRLSGDERDYLLGMAMCQKAKTIPSSQSRAFPEWKVPAGVLAILERLDPTPALVVGPWLDVLASNPSWERLVRPLGMLEGDPPNLARYTFLHPKAPEVYADWSALADEQASRLRAASVHWAEVPGLAELLESLRAAPGFAERWDAHAVEAKRRGTKVIRHPAGELRVDFEALSLPDDGGLRLITWLPGDKATAAVVDATVVEALRPDLRVVGRS